MKPRLEIRNLSVRFAGQSNAAVDNVSLTVGPGRMRALVGESGSGKTLTALSILKLLPPQAQCDARGIYLDEEDIFHAPVKRLRELRGGRIGMIFQEPLSALNPLKQVEQQVRENIQVHQPLTREATRARVLELLHQVRLPEPETLLARYPHQLSGGQRQRVMIAMALANNPTVLIADEPTTALDVTVQEGVLDLLKALQRDLQLSVLLITHDLGIVARYAEDVSVMCDGKIVEQGETLQVLAEPAHEYTRHLLANAPAGSAPAASDQAPVQLEARQLSVHFQQRKGWLGKAEPLIAVDSVDLHVRSGETLGIVGESGSGKSTLAMALLRLLPSNGTIRLGEVQLDRLQGRAVTPYRSRMQVVFQDPWGTLNPRLTIGQIVAEGLRVHQPGLSAEHRDQRVCETLTEVGLDASAQHRYPHEFSGGQRQRIAIARALILRPQVLVLDEPTSALDRSVQHQVLELLKELQKRHGLTYILISHDLRVVRSISHRLLVMHEGKVVESGPTEAIFTDPQQPYTRRLLHAAFDESLKYTA